MKLIAWNMAHRLESWCYLLNADTDADVALLSEALAPPSDVAPWIDVDSAPWQTAGAGGNRPWRTAVVKLSKGVEVRWLDTKALADALPGDLAVSRLGTLAAAIVTSPAIDPIVVVSMYGVWESPHPTTGSRWIYADGSVHRLISDLSALVGQQAGHRIIVAGDLNILNGYGENHSRYWASRYATVFARMEALGLSFVGPQALNGRMADPWPDELPTASTNVPTYHTNRQEPASATRQLDFVFASSGLADCVSVRALNEAEQWGPSDHCRIAIELS